MTRRPDFESTDKPIDHMDTSPLTISDVILGLPLVTIFTCIFYLVISIIGGIFGISFSASTVIILGIVIGTACFAWMCRQPPSDFEQNVPKSRDSDIEKML